MITLLSFAAAPFIVKAFTMAFVAKGYGLQSLYKFAQIFVVLAWRRAHGEKGFSIAWPIHEAKPSFSLLGMAIGSGVLFGFAAIVAVRALTPIYGMDPTVIRAGFDNTFAVDGIFALVVCAFLAFINSAIEEMHFRVWLDGEVSKRIGDACGIAVSSVAFGAMHGFVLWGFPTMPTSMSALILCCLIGAGTCWSLMVRRTGGIYAAWISHGLTDAILLMWGLFWLGYL